MALTKISFVSNFEHFRDCSILDFELGVLLITRPMLISRSFVKQKG